MIRPYYCAWCGERLPDPIPGSRGQPRKTCGRSRCRRLNGQYLQQQAADEVATAEATEEATLALAELREQVAEAHSHSQRLLGAVGNAIEDAERMKSPQRQLRHLQERLTNDVRPEVVALWERLGNTRRL